MRRVLVAAAAAFAAGALAALPPGQAVPPGGLRATVERVPDQAREQRFPTYDAAGRRGRDAVWRVTEAGGNCCEVFVAATPDGRLLEFGGSFPLVSDDRGRSWYRVKPVNPILGGEGAISAAPGGDVVGIGWDPYTGDHLQAFRYDGEARTWTFSEVPLHEPFHDRPWIAVLPGPFTLADGSEAKYATVVRSNYLSELKDTFLVSFDGLTYVPTTALPQSRVAGGTATGYLDPATVPILDYVQPHRRSRLAALARGGMLNVTPGGGTRCPATVWSRSQQWSCYEMPDHTLRTSLVVDSRGWLHEIELDGGALIYRLSADGGRTWRETRLTPPRGAVLDGLTVVDHKANGAVGVAAVAARVTTGSTGQDLVFRVDVSSRAPRLVETLHVGAGDLATASGVTHSVRFDFASVAILPDGAFAVAFHDAHSNDPSLAVEAVAPSSRRR